MIKIPNLVTFAHWGQPFDYRNIIVRCQSVRAQFEFNRESIDKEYASFNIGYRYQKEDSVVLTVTFADRHSVAVWGL